MSEELNPEQEKAAQFTDGICAVIAVPGSGKTRTMMERIGILVKKHGIPPENILGLTFTRNAADEMRNRLVPVLGDLASRVTLSTLHSFCHYLLRREGIVFEILCGKEQINCVRKIIEKFGYKELSVGMVLREISLAKNNLVEFEEFVELHQGDKTMMRIGEVYKAYDQLKAGRKLLDFDDLLLEAHRLIRDKQDARSRYQEVFRHILVDEWQDTNPAQLELLKLLIGPGKNGQGASFWVAGDDAQAIYGFTGASVGNILGFEELFPNSSRMFLTLNYRSTPQILAACHNLIRHNERQIKKDLNTLNPSGEDVIVLESSSEETEAMSLVHEIQDLVDRRGLSHRDIAVLYRCNFQSRAVEEAFLQHKVPYHVQNGLSFYERHEVRGLLDYLTVIRHPGSESGDEALLRIINTPNRYIGRTFCMALREHSNRKNVSLFEGLSSMKIEPAYLKKNVRAFEKLLKPLMEEADSLEPSEVLSIVRASLDWDRFVTEDDMPSPDDAKIQNIEQLVLASCRFKDIDSFLEYTSSFSDSGVSGNPEGVSLMTVHKAKGLEFPAVFVIGMVEGIMPTRKDASLEEERRVAFVAMSRAMHLLYLSTSQTYLGQPAKKSVFLDEIRQEQEEPIRF